MLEKIGILPEDYDMYSHIPNPKGLPVLILSGLGLGMVSKKAEASV